MSQLVSCFVVSNGVRNVAGEVLGDQSIVPMVSKAGSIEDGSGTFNSTANNSLNNCIRLWSVRSTGIVAPHEGLCGSFELLRTVRIEELHLVIRSCELLHRSNSVFRSLLALG